MRRSSAASSGMILGVDAARVSGLPAAGDVITARVLARRALARAVDRALA